jgi:hypothetical protein
MAGARRQHFHRILSNKISSLNERVHDLLFTKSKWGGRSIRRVIQTDGIIAALVATFLLDN